MQHDDTRLEKENPARQISLNTKQNLYVIATAAGCSCFGFDYARDHAHQIAERLGRADLALADIDYAALSGYQKYEEAVLAWSRSAQSKQTYFDPGTARKAGSVLESCRRTGDKVRLVLGNTVTGEPWLNEHDVVGRIGRSSGHLKVPLLMEDGKSYGSAILTACLLAIIDWTSGRTLYRHVAYREPDLSLKPTDSLDRP